MPILADYHMHTPRCKHAAGPLEAYVERGIALGLREIGFADHNPLPHGYGSNVRMDEGELDGYVAEVLRLRERYRGAISVRLGLEMDYVEGLDDYLRAQAARHPWDYIIGSVHYLDPACKAFAWPRNFAGDIHALNARYFTLVEQMAATGLIDIVAHFDLPKRTGIPASPLEDAPIARALDAVARAGICLEINTSGFRHHELVEPGPYPSAGIVHQALALGIPFTVNSDAHTPEHVGADFPAMEALLRAAGCTTLYRFAARRRAPYPLNGDPA